MENDDGLVLDIVPIKGDPNKAKEPKQLSVYEWFRSSMEGYRECISLKRQRRK
jgi:hypothetical protein